MEVIPKSTRGIIQDDQEEFAREILTKINEYRLQHEAKSIKLNSNVSSKFINLKIIITSIIYYIKVIFILLYSISYYSLYN